TTFARALIRYLAGDPSLEAPSPTFTLVQQYDLPRFPIYHADLYRVSNASEVAEIGIEDRPDNAVLLVEWPDRAPQLMPKDRWEISLKVKSKYGRNFRSVDVIGHGTYASRLDRLVAGRRFIEENGYGQARRERVTGDASSRSYERLTIGKHDIILMNSPKRPDGPPVKDGKPYSEIAHLAEDVAPFIAMANGLRSRGFSAPEIYAADINDGFIALEDLGDNKIVSGDPPAPIRQCYEAAVYVLIALHKQILPDLLPVAPHVNYRVPAYDLDAFMIEVELLLDWYLPFRRVTLSETARAEFRTIWEELLTPAAQALETWVLRDFHSPNLLWLPERRGIACLGLLDFQDAVLGPAAYDLASLLQDARVDVPAQWESELLRNYVRARAIDDPKFDPAAFAKLYATMAAQRATKILGIFARLNRRDRKPQYLRHLPRIWGYLHRAFVHPDLARLEQWYKTNVPPPESSK
ncbi:MAG TPA: tRNA (adenosine(37)-N6)-threonylcarbamoyltransferase complex ATPase subunit type 1 TsaE, partial [Xanthobacteraceae bacterium]|nr:tRNA (adenosine(37)-N6)-threonylcarbamoyltransferase complex ATPase subunit type 1 TsaE [Xanthobacteraceae bacterium]